MHSKLFLENNKKKISCSSFIFQPSAAQDALNRLGPACLARTGRTQAATWAWAGKAPRALAPAWASTWPSASRAFDLIRRTSGRFAWIKNQAAAGALENPSHFGSSPLSLLAACLFSAAAETVTAEQPRARKTGASFGAVAGPLAGARAPQRVSTPPSSGLAAALSWPSPALSWPSPGASARFLLQRRRKKNGALLLLLPRRW